MTVTINHEIDPRDYLFRATEGITKKSPQFMEIIELSSKTDNAQFTRLSVSRA